jgi:uncharacterized protein (DUF362 family)
MKFDESRRDFIKRTVGIGLGIYGLTKLEYPLVGTAEASRKSSVVIARDGDVIDSSLKVDQNIISRMLDDAVKKLAGKNSTSSAWKEYFRSDDIVGIKVNTLSGRWMCSHPELVAAIVDGLRSAGVKKKNIIIWDRFDKELIVSGFKLNTKSSNDPRCFGTSAVGYEKDIKMYGSIASRLSKIVDHCTAFVNVPVLKHHGDAGVTLCMKNWFGAINNPSKYHFDTSSKKRMLAACDYIPDLNSMIFSSKGMGKRQLIICDAIMSQYDKGPGYRPNMAWNYGGLIVSVDPVALDRIGAQIIDKKRLEVGLKPLSEVGREPKYISIAADRSHRLGTDNLSKIELISAGTYMSMGL